MTVNQTCDVLIIGAGVMGCALAHDLSQKGRDVIVVDRSAICSGSSGANAGGVRHQFTAEINIRMASRSIERIASSEEEMGVHVSFKRVGYLFLVSHEDSAQVLRSAVEVQRTCGLESDFLSPDAVQALVPPLFVDGLIGGAFCRFDGHLDPHALVAGFAVTARRNGVTFCQNWEVTDLEVSADRVVSVRSSSGDSISPLVVVNAAGAWAPRLARLAGSDLPITPWFSQVFLISQVEGLPERLPMTIDLDNGKSYFHREGNAILAGNDDGTPYDAASPVAFDEARAPVLIDRLTRRCPAFESARLKGGWAGLLEITPDENPIVGWVGAENLYVAAGFSGHGLSIAPGLSREVARELCDEPTELDLDAYRPGRFAAPTIASERLSLR